MNVIGDADAAQKLARLKAQIGGLTGQDDMDSARQAIETTIAVPKSSQDAHQTH